VERQNHIICVGRWETKQKDLPLVLKALEDFLALQPDWSATLIGTEPRDLDQRLKRIRPEVRNRVRFAGKLPHRDLARFYQSAKIYFLASRHEGFCIAAAEALCCGCAVVGPVDTAGMQFVAGYASGTVSCRRSRHHLVDALCAEAAAWEAGWRDPRQIAGTWTQRVSARVVAGQYLKALRDLPG
jgi:glycosyltransferase involved in cell wall biosynthesis